MKLIGVVSTGAGIAEFKVLLVCAASIIPVKLQCVEWQDTLESMPK